VKSSHLPDLSHITKIYSHPQAWGQCKSFLSTHLHGIERQDVSSTSRAAELASADTTGTSAAIASKIAAELIHPLDVLVEGIEDNEGNSTRFFVLRKLNSGEDSPSCSSSTSQPSHDNDEEVEQHKTLITFTLLQHGSSGALADSLAVFKKHGINLTSINTRPSGQRAWDYVFFVEFQGRRGSKRVDAALEELGREVKGWRWLGSWRSRLGAAGEEGS
jgi:prephenate dehydratase